MSDSEDEGWTNKDIRKWRAYTHLATSSLLLAHGILQLVSPRFLFGFLLPGKKIGNTAVDLVRMESPATIALGAWYGWCALGDDDEQIHGAYIGSFGFIAGAVMMLLSSFGFNKIGKRMPAATLYALTGLNTFGAIAHGFFAYKGDC